MQEIRSPVVLSSLLYFFRWKRRRAWFFNVGAQGQSCISRREDGDSSRPSPWTSTLAGQERIWGFPVLQVAGGLSSPWRPEHPFLPLFFAFPTERRAHPRRPFKQPFPFPSSPLGNPEKDMNIFPMDTCFFFRSSPPLSLHAASVIIVNYFELVPFVELPFFL